MVQKSGVHQLRLVNYPIIYKVRFLPGSCLGFFSINSMMGSSLLDRINFSLRKMGFRTYQKPMDLLKCHVSNRKKTPMTFHEILIGSWGSVQWLFVYNWVV